MNAKANAVLVEALGSSLRYGGSALEDVPGLLKQLLTEDAWREFTTPRGEFVRHERFADFVATPPTAGIGASMDLIDRIVGTGDPDLLLLLREAKKGRPGRPRKEREIIDESSKFSQDHDADDLERLAREVPAEYEAVKRGERSINAAAIRAGFRRRRIPVRLDSPESAAQTLRKHMPLEARQALARLLLEE